jgi:hypothetical protein
MRSGLKRKRECSPVRFDVSTVPGAMTASSRVHNPRYSSCLKGNQIRPRKRHDYSDTLLGPAAYDRRTAAWSASPGGSHWRIAYAPSQPRLRATPSVSTSMRSKVEQKRRPVRPLLVVPISASWAHEARLAKGEENGALSPQSSI